MSKPAKFGIGFWLKDADHVPNPPEPPRKFNTVIGADAPVVSMRLGPMENEWGRETDRGDCKECGGQCGPECGIHPMGCIFGGFSYGYWMIVDGCTLDHGEPR